MTYSISLMDIDKNFNDILRLWKNNLSLSSEERFNWFYKENSERPLTFIAANEESKEVVGCGSLYIRTLIINGQSLKIGIAADFALNEGHRGFGPAVKLQREITKKYREAGLDLIVAYPNKASIAVFRRVGYKVAGDTNNWVKLLRTEQKISRYVKIGILAKLIGFSLNKLIHLIDLRHRISGAQTYATETLESCDNRFDKLWSENSSAYNVIGERSSKYLNWRFSDNKNNKYYFFCLFDKNKNLMGYIVYSIKDNIAIVADLFFVDMVDSMELLMLEFIKKMRRDKIYSISLSYYGNEMFTDKMKKLNFVKRDNARSIVVCLDKKVSPEIKKMIMDKKQWFSFDEDWDL